MDMEKIGVAGGGLMGHGIARGADRFGIEGPEVGPEFELLPGLGAQGDAIEQGPDANGGA